MKMKKNIDYVLVAPGNFQFVLLVNGQDIFNPAKCSHSSEIHKHHSRIDTERTVVWVTGKTVVPEAINN
jgi:hypothetical protein